MSASDKFVSAVDTPAQPSQSFTCHACQSIFENSASQRMHFKTDWHIANVKRNVEPLPSERALSEAVQPSDAKLIPRIPNSGFSPSTTPGKKIDNRLEKYSDRPQSSKSATKSAPLSAEGSSADDLGSDDEDQATVPPAFNPSSCLFCVHQSSDLEASILHMQTVHGLSIPEQSRLIHLESLIRYLFTVIFEFNECVYCGIVKWSVKGIQQHMSTKGHCKISKPDKGSEYRDFYDFSDAEDDAESDLGTANAEGGDFKRDDILEISGDFVRLPSGRTLGHRSTTAHRFRKDSHQGQQEKSSRRQEASDKDVTSVSALDRPESQIPQRAQTQLQTRTSDEKGLIGVSEAQRRAIRATEKKMLKVEIKARNRFEAAVQRAADERPDLRKRRTTRVPDSV